MIGKVSSLLFLLFIGFKSFADCKGFTVSEAYKASDYVIVGKVLSVDTLELVDSNAIKNPAQRGVVRERLPTKIMLFSTQLLVEKTFKGKITEDTVQVLRGGYRGGGLVLGKSFIIYGHKNASYMFSEGDFNEPIGENLVWLHHCGRLRYRTAKEMKELEMI